MHVCNWRPYFGGRKVLTERAGSSSALCSYRGTDASLFLATTLNVTDIFKLTFDF